MTTNGATVPADTRYHIGYQCGTDAQKFVDVKAGEFATIDGIPTGTLCEVTEAKPTDPPTGWSYSDPTFDPANGKVTVTENGGTVTVTVTNELTRDTGKLKITKIFDKPANFDQDVKFKIDYTCQEGFHGTASLDGSQTGDSITIDDVPTGDCSFVEQGLPNIPNWTWDAVMYAPPSQEVKVETGKTAEATVTNTVTRNTAELKLVKQVEGGSSTAHDWTLTATGPEGAPSVENPGDEGDFTEVWSGVDYTLAETGPDNYTASTWECVSDHEQVERDVVQEGDTVNLDKGETVTCTIVNSRDLAQLKLVKKVVGGKAAADEFTLTATADPKEKQDRNLSTPGGSGQFEGVYAGTQYTLAETGPGGYTGGQWVCESSEVQPEMVQNGDKITLRRGDRVTCTIVNTRDLGSLTITKDFNPQTSGFTGTFDINYVCVDGADPVKSGTVKLGDGKSETISGLPTGTTCTVTEPKLPTPPSGWQFNDPTLNPASGQVTVTAKDQTVSVTVINSITEVNPIAAKRICPIEPTLVKKIKVKKNGDRVLIKKIRTNKANCVLLKPVVLCQPLGSAAAGETAFCDTKVTKRGRVTVSVKGYDKVRVKVIVRAKPKPGHEDLWKPNTRRKSWVLRS